MLIYAGGPYTLRRIDPQTGGFDQGVVLQIPNSASVQAMAFSSDGQLLMLSSLTNTLFKVDKTTGSLLSTIPLTGPSPLGVSGAGMDFHPQTGSLYVIANTLTAVPSQRGNLYTLDPETGALALVGPNASASRPFSPHGLTLVPVPEPATIVAIGSGMLIVGATVRQKRGFVGRM